MDVREGYASSSVCLLLCLFVSLLTADLQGCWIITIKTGTNVKKII